MHRLPVAGNTNMTPAAGGCLWIVTAARHVQSRRGDLTEEVRCSSFVVCLPGNSFLSPNYLAGGSCSKSVSARSSSTILISDPCSMGAVEPLPLVRPRRQALNKQLCSQRSCFAFARGSPVDSFHHRVSRSRSGALFHRLLISLSFLGKIIIPSCLALRPDENPSVAVDMCTWASEQS